MALGWARLVRVTWLLLLLSAVEGHLLSQGVLVSDGKHLFLHPQVFHGELTDQGWVPESLLKKHNNRLVVGLWDDVSFVVESLDELLEGLSLLQDDTAHVPVDSRMCAHGVEVTGEQPA
jgi:hypothetical protein